jgi:hypothetical protein
MKNLTLIIILTLSLFLFGCKEEKLSCDFGLNDMIDITGQIIDTHHYIDKLSNPASEKTIVTIRTSTCDVFAVKQTIDYQRTKSEDQMLKVKKICIEESEGAVSFKGLYREYYSKDYFYDIMPSYCSKETELVDVYFEN